MSEWVNGMFEQFSKVKQVGTITGLDYWTHPNCKIHVVQCRIEAKHRYLLTQLLH